MTGYLKTKWDVHQIPLVTWGLTRASMPGEQQWRKPIKGDKLFEDHNLRFSGSAGQAVPGGEELRGGPDGRALVGQGSRPGPPRRPGIAQGLLRRQPWRHRAHLPASPLAAGHVRTGTTPESDLYSQNDPSKGSLRFPEWWLNLR